MSNPKAGIKMIGYFALWVLLSEITTMSLGGNIGSFLWVTFHFIINPIIGGIIVLFAIWHTIKQRIIWLRIITIMACIVPLLVIYIGYTGNFWIYDVLDLKIQN
jgi:hypothetical protein